MSGKVETTPAAASAAPDDALLASIEEAATEAVTRSGALVAERFGGALEVMSKTTQAGRELVTDVDHASQKLIGELISQRFPGHMLLGEEQPPETEPPAADFVWAVDPIDGTTNFVNGVPVHAVSVGVLYRGRPVVGAIWVPWPGEPGCAVVHARLGGGAWRDGVRLTIADNEGLPILDGGRLVAVPMGLRGVYDIANPLASAMGEPRVSGSVAYELAMVTMGKMQLAISGVASVWDFAAGTVLVKEAGGWVLTLDGRGGWEAFRGWGQPFANDQETSESMRRWKGPMLSGPPRAAAFVAANLKPRHASLWQRAVRTLTG